MGETRHPKSYLEKITFIKITGFLAFIWNLFGAYTKEAIRADDLNNNLLELKKQAQGN